MILKQLFVWLSKQIQVSDKITDKTDKITVLKGEMILERKFEKLRV